MAISGKIRQRKWKERQSDKKQVTVMLSEAAFDDLKKVKERTGESYSMIMDRAVSNFSNSVTPENIKQKQMVAELAAYRKRKDNLMKTFSNEFAFTNEQLPQKSAARPQTENILKESEEGYRIILENSYDVIFRANLNEKTFEYVSPSSIRLLGYTPEDLKVFGFKILKTLVHPDDQERLRLHFKEVTECASKNGDMTIEMRINHKTQGYRWMSNTCTLLFDKNKQPIAVVGNVRDIHRLKQAELESQRIRESLDRKVRENTVSLEEANKALKLMLKKEKEIKTELEDKVLCNVKELVLPYAERLKTSRLDGRQRNYLNILESNLNNIVSPFLRSLTSKFLELTPGEIEVANLIKQGKRTKEIADLLNLSVRTIEFHRANIRKKMGINNKKQNLRSCLLTLS